MLGNVFVVVELFDLFEDVCLGEIVGVSERLLSVGIMLEGLSIQDEVVMMMGKIIRLIMLALVLMFLLVLVLMLMLMLVLMLVCVRIMMFLLVGTHHEIMILVI